MEKNPNAYAELKISLDELTLVHELLNIETVLMVKYTIESEKNIDDKVVNVVTFFDDFRMFSDKLLFLKTDIRRISPGISNDAQTPIVMSHNMAKAIVLLCKEVVGGIIPNTHADLLWEKYGDVLVNKLHIALDSPSFSYEEAKNRYSVEEKETAKELGINVLNNKARA